MSLNSPSVSSTASAHALGRYWAALDQLLRGRIQETSLPVVRVWTFWQLVGASLYGVALGVYALTNRDVADPRFLLAGAVKMPLLLLLTTCITCPSLYVFGALQGLRFSASQFASMLIVAHTVLAAVLGSLAPVLAFFSVTTQSYSFMILSAVATCTLAGAFGLRWFLKALHPVAGAVPVPVATDAADRAAGEDPDTVDVPARMGHEPDAADVVGDPDRAPHGDPKAAPALRERAVAARPRPPREGALWKVLSWWLLLYAFVGAQLGWMLRPFVGDPGLEFVWIRDKSGSFAEAVLKHLANLLGA